MWLEHDNDDCIIRSLRRESDLFMITIKIACGAFFHIVAINILVSYSSNFQLSLSIIIIFGLHKNTFN